MAVDPALIPPDEEARLAAVRRYDILDTPPDGAFDRLTSLAARQFGVPIAIVSVVDSDRIWFKSHHGVEVQEIGRDPGLCASAILQDRPWVVTDAAADPRTLANPLVAGEAGMRFYAGVPLQTAEGHNLGTLCVLDTEPREVTDEETATLVDLAAIAMDELELRLSARTAVAREQELRDQAERTARSLQESLLPSSLPTVPGADVSALYLPAAAGQVGGDFYDVFEAPGGSWMLSLGDVSGKGPNAAAVTALTRHTIRTAALSMDDPVAIVELLNGAMFLGRDEDDLQHFSTVHLSALKPVDGGFELVSVSAAHPEALVVRAAGEVDVVEAGGPPVGWHREASYTAAHTRLNPGDTLVIHTDGLSEARRGDRLVGRAGVAALIAEAPGESADALTARILESLRRDDVDVRDDAAAVVLRVR